MKWIPSLALLLALGPGAIHAASGHANGPGASSGLEKHLSQAVAKGIPGISAAVATREGVRWSGAAGLADLQAGTAVRPDMLVGIGSITKIFVAVVILQLAEEGRLDLNATASKLLGATSAGIPNAGRATIAQLLNHTGGVPSWEDDPAWIREGRGVTLDVSRIWGKTDTLPSIKGHAPLTVPGVKFNDANTNYTLLGMIIEQVTGREAASEIRRRILEPLGINDFYLEGFESVPPHRYHWAPRDFRKNAGVNAAFREVRPDLIDASRSNLSVEWTAGGIVATARDLALFGVALRDGRLLKPKSMNFMMEWFPIGKGEQMGHNWFRQEFRGGPTIIGHGGDVLGFDGCLFWIDGGDAVVAVLGNVGSMHSGVVPEVVMAMAWSSAFADQVAKLCKQAK